MTTRKVITTRYLSPSELDQLPGLLAQVQATAGFVADVFVCGMNERKKDDLPEALAGFAQTDSTLEAGTIGIRLVKLEGPAPTTSSTPEAVTSEED